VELGTRAVLLMARGLVPTLAPSRYSVGYGRDAAALQVCVRSRVAAGDALRWVLLFN